MITQVLLATTLLLPVQHAQSAPPLAATTGPWVVCAAADQDAACTHLFRAWDLLVENQRKEAGRELERAVRARQDAGQYAGEELWQLAAFQYEEGQIRRAARTLDALAIEAQHNGDLDRQATALMEAIFLYVDLRETDAARTRLERIRPLIESPYMPVETSQAVRQRLQGV
jgi:hypothetical protein